MARNQPITKIEAIGLALAIIALALWFVPATQVWLADRGVHVVIAWVILTMGAAGLEKLSARSWKRIGLTTVVTGILAGSLLLLVSWSEQRRAIPEPTPTPYVEVVVYPLFRDAYETYKLQLGLPNKNGEDAGETYIYAFEHAEVFWSWVLGGFYKIPINNERKWEYNKEPVFKQGVPWDSRSYVRKRLHLAPKFSPPLFGAAAAWDESPAEWNWVGELWWISYAPPQKVFYQQFEQGKNNWTTLGFQ